MNGGMKVFDGFSEVRVGHCYARQFVPPCLLYDSGFPVEVLNAHYQVCFVTISKESLAERITLCIARLGEKTESGQRHHYRQTFHWSCLLHIHLWLVAQALILPPLIVSQNRRLCPIHPGLIETAINGVQLLNAQRDLSGLMSGPPALSQPGHFIERESPITWEERMPN